MMSSNKTKTNGSPTVQVVSGEPTVQSANPSGVLTTITANESRPSSSDDSASAAPKMSRAQAEVKYSRLLDSTMALMESLETAVQQAPNTKTDIKAAVKSIGLTFREFASFAKMLGIVRNPDAVEQRIRALQQLQQQQHSQTLKLFSELRVEQARSLEQGHAIQATPPVQALPHELETINLQLAEQGKKLDLMSGTFNTLVEKAQAPKLNQRQRNANQADRQRQLQQQQKQKQQRQQQRQDNGGDQENGGDQLEGPTQEQLPEWTEVRRRRPKPAKATKEAARTTPAKKIGTEAMVRRRVPKTEAVTIAEPAEGETYASVMRLVTSCIDPQELGIQIGKVRRTKAGAILMEVNGKEAADKLSSHLSDTIGQRAKVSRPRRMTPVLIINIPDWVDDDKVKSAIAAADPSIEVVGISLRDNAGGGKVAKLMVDVETALKLSALKGISIGWNLCRVKLLEAKAPICFRCQARGHVAAACQAAEAQPKKCYRCQGTDHLAATCQGVKPRQKESVAAGPAERVRND